MHGFVAILLFFSLVYVASSDNNRYVLHNMYPKDVPDLTASNPNLQRDIKTGRHVSMHFSSRRSKDVRDTIYDVDANHDCTPLAIRNVVHI